MHYEYRPFYPVAGNRVAVDLLALADILNVSSEEIETLLKRRGFERLRRISPVQEARRCVGSSTYQRGALPSEMPTIIDCSGLVKWAYGRLGVGLPRRTIQQMHEGIRVSPKVRVPGDLVFIQGRCNFYLRRPEEGVGHVGIVTERNTIIHANGTRRGVVEEPHEDFFDRPFVAAVRIVPDMSRVSTWIIPEQEQERIERCDDVLWVLCQDL